MSDDRVGFLKHLVEINSGSRNIEGVNKVQNVLAHELTTLGFDVQLLKQPQRTTGDFLIAEKGSKDRKKITLVTHADTVFEESSPFNKFEISADGKTARGPGVIDDKGGIVVALMGLRQFLEEGGDLPLRFISSPAEEIGSPGFTEHLQKLGLDSSIVLGFEPALESGGIVDSRRGSRWIRVQVKGKEAHAGRDHAKGVNAARELAIKIDRLERLTRYSKQVTVNVGTMRAGNGKINVVCGEAEAFFDIRFPNLSERKKVFDSITKELKRVHVKAHKGNHKAKTAWEILEDCPPLSKQSRTPDFANAYLAIINQIEKKRFVADVAGGAADSNHMARKNLVVLDGLGAKGKGTHSHEEIVEIDSLFTRAEALARFLKHLSLQKGLDGV